MSLPVSFAEGDVVSRIIGGPLMTVEEFLPKTREGCGRLVSCVWFNVEGEVRRDAFAANTLRRWVLVE